jgi:membrane protease YdiL (CAAX protease family)
MNNTKQTFFDHWRNLTIKHPIITSLLMLVFILLASRTIGRNYFQVSRENITFFLLSGTILSLVLYLRMFNINLFFLGIKKVTYPYFIYPILLAISSTILLYFSYGFSWITPIDILRNLSIGLTEEILIRSITFGVLLYVLKGKKNYIFNSALYSSLIFGVLHLSNIIENPTDTTLILATLFQVFYATLFGIFFAGLTYKAQSIWPAVIYHAIIDLISFRESYIPNTPNDTWIQQSIDVGLIPITVILGTVIGIKYLRDEDKKEKLKTIV